MKISSLKIVEVFALVSKIYFFALQFGNMSLVMCILLIIFTSRVSRSGLPRGPASHRRKGGSERPQASEGHGELRVEHHRAQGETTGNNALALGVLNTTETPQMIALYHQFVERTNTF